MIQITLFTLIITLFTGCGEFLFPRDQNIIYTSHPWLFTVECPQRILDRPTQAVDVDKFIEKLDAYTNKVMPQLAATVLLDDDVTVPGNQYVEQLRITISDQLVVRGLYTRSGNIILRPESKMVSVYGHELVRHLLFVSGDQGAAVNSSLDWSGDVGVLWDIAETVSLEFI